MTLDLLLAFVLGALFEGILCLILKFRISTFGILEVNTTDPEKDLFNLKVESVDDLYKKKQLIVKITKDKNTSK